MKRDKWRLAKDRGREREKETDRERKETETEKRKVLKNTLLRIFLLVSIEFNGRTTFVFIFSADQYKICLNIDMMNGST